MSYDKNGISDTADAIEAGALLGEPQQIGPDLYSVLVPSGAAQKTIDVTKLMEEHQSHPARKKGKRALASVESFIAYVNAHSTGSTAVYSDKKQTKFTAVFNDHEPAPREMQVKQMPFTSTLPDAVPQPVREAIAQVAQDEASADAAAQPAGTVPTVRMSVVEISMPAMGRAGWGDFTATYDCPVSVEWKRWTEKSQHNVDQKKGMEQAEFMAFLEDNLLDVTNPASGLLLQAVQSFEARKDASIKSATRLDNGSVVFNYTETINEVPQEGKLSLPSLFTITVPVFDGGAKYEQDARLRYRISSGKLILWYELVSPHKNLEHAFNGVLSQVNEGVEGTPVYSV